MYNNKKKKHKIEPQAQQSLPEYSTRNCAYPEDCRKQREARFVFSSSEIMAVGASASGQITATNWNGVDNKAMKQVTWTKTRVN